MYHGAAHSKQLCKRFIKACKQSVSSRKKAARDKCLSNLGYFSLVVSRNGSISDRDVQNKAKQLLKLRAKLVKVGSNGKRVTTDWQKAKAEDILDDGTKLVEINNSTGKATNSLFGNEPEKKSFRAFRKFGDDASMRRGGRIQIDSVMRFKKLLPFASFLFIHETINKYQNSLVCKGYSDTVEIWFTRSGLETGRL